MSTPTATPTRAVVVDDSSFMRTVISDVLREGEIEIVAQAADGAGAVERLRTTSRTWSRWTSRCPP